MQVVDLVPRRESPTVRALLEHAVGFYLRLGFQVTSLGELWPGTERFRCHLTTTTPDRESSARPA